MSLYADVMQRGGPYNGGPDSGGPARPSSRFDMMPWRQGGGGWMEDGYPQYPDRMDPNWKMKQQTTNEDPWKGHPNYPGDGPTMYPGGSDTFDEGRWGRAPWMPDGGITQDPRFRFGPPGSEPNFMPRGGVTDPSAGYFRSPDMQPTRDPYVGLPPPPGQFMTPPQGTFSNPGQGANQYWGNLQSSGMVAQAQGPYQTGGPMPMLDNSSNFIDNLSPDQRMLALGDFSGLQQQEMQKKKMQMEMEMKRQEYAQKMQMQQAQQNAMIGQAGQMQPPQSLQQNNNVMQANQMSNGGGQMFNNPFNQAYNQQVSSVFGNGNGGGGGNSWKQPAQQQPAQTGGPSWRMTSA